MCSIQCTPHLLGGGRCSVAVSSQASGADFYRVKLFLLCGGRGGVREKCGAEHFRSRRRVSVKASADRASWIGRAQPLSRKKLGICAGSRSSGGQLSDENFEERAQNSAAVIGEGDDVAGTRKDDSEVGVSEASKKFSNLKEYGQKSQNDRSSSEQSSSQVQVEGFDRSVEAGGVSGQVEVQNGPSQGHDSGEARMPAPWNIGALLAIVWDRVMRNSLVAFITSWPAWQKRRKLERLLTEADENPQDADKQAALLRELLKQRPQAVLERFEKREYAVDGKAVVEYLRALVATDAIAGYIPDESKGRSSELSRLLQSLMQRVEGNSDKLLAPPGLTEQQPLHVVMVESKANNKSMRFVQELISTVLFMIIFSVMWVVGAAAIRKYVNGVAGVGSTSGISGSNLYSPKEFNKENVPEKNVKTFNDVKGCDEAKEELEEIVEYLKNPAKFTRLGGKLPKGVLLTGPPGTGKTLLAKAIAGEAGVPFFYRAGSEFEEMFVGVGARRVRSLFQAAKKKAPCIVFIDEIDAVGGSRKQWEGHTKKTLNQLLVEMDGFDANEGIIVLAATNLPETLDPALTRPGRFDRHVVVSNPDSKGRKEILNLYLQDKPLADDVDVQMLARGTPGFSGADLANMVNMAAVKAAVDGIDKITNKQLEFAKDKLLMGTERKSMALTEESRKLTAYHESGHAVVAFNTQGANPIHKATITPRGVSLGMVTQLPDKDETSVSKKQMLARLDVCMGGRVAEEMVFGPDQVTSGARSDLQQATALARHMVTECGMSDAVGPVFIDSKLSGDFQKSIDAEVVRLLKEAYERVKKLLKLREADLHKLAKALLENETLDAKEIKEILSPLQLVEDLDTSRQLDTVPSVRPL
ncbi:ATP-dependent zinc metalloprotease FTSH 9, chloroplastic/mitochondrial [Physcomitrium patens]|uniref:AAA+ ATPase domain-containing protein n=1 Tax=Physcomitrium patens TaxID=3218 RepID=A0A2K1IUD2_PHYPA|nr:ATP-dependent zinc metalloprotease FTSH 9, chloroplastic/mitochondrial-like [Physcomitrium patens]PNR32887.1 hypothetical protein PHYPA_024830 [Physcomitrium patens]|eukprot:XP_024357561.1 ATP-dependent zinc metalloprotease FTSH 9, chloroplastic/mitochondrial-like [Physcomitrella patens]